MLFTLWSPLSVRNYIYWCERKAKLSMVFIGKERCESVRDFVFLNLSIFEEYDCFKKLIFYDWYNTHLFIFFIFVMIYWESEFIYIWLFLCYFSLFHSSFRIITGAQSSEACHKRGVMKINQSTNGRNLSANLAVGRSKPFLHGRMM